MSRLRERYPFPAQRAASGERHFVITRVRQKVWEMDSFRAMLTRPAGVVGHVLIDELVQPTEQAIDSDFRPTLS